MDGSPAGLDPHVGAAFNSVPINKNIYEGLTAIDKDLKIVPVPGHLHGRSPRTA